MLDNKALAFSNISKIRDLFTFKSALKGIRLILLAHGIDNLNTENRLAHGIYNHVLRKTHAAFVKQNDTFCTFWPKN